MHDEERSAVSGIGGPVTLYLVNGGWRYSFSWPAHVRLMRPNLRK